MSNILLGCRFFGPSPFAIKLMVVIKLQTVYQSIKWVVKSSLDGGSDCPPGNGHSHKDILTTSVFQHNLNVMGVLSRVAWSQLLKFKPIETGLEDAAIVGTIEFLILFLHLKLLNCTCWRVRALHENYKREEGCCRRDFEQRKRAITLQIRLDVIKC